MNNIENWKIVFGKTNERKKDQEFILRFISFLYMRDQYVKPLKEFMNLYMARNRYLKMESGEEIIKIFSKTISFVADILGKKAFRPISAINASVFDSMMVGIAERLLKGNINEKELFRNAYHDLLKNEDYLKATTDATSDNLVVEKRINYTVNAFKNIG